MSASAVLSVETFEIELQARDQGELPPFPGALWRSAMGLHLRRALCFTGFDACSACPARRRCGYAYVMETPAPENGGLLTQSKDAPHPYLLRPARGGAFHPGDVTRIAVTLFGDGIHHSDAVLKAVMRAAEQGLGRDGKRLRFVATQTGHRNERLSLPLAADASASTTELDIELLTPLSLRVRGQYLRPDSLAFQPLFTALMRRISQLAALHGRTELHQDYRSLSQAACEVHLIPTGLRWHEDARFSARQKRQVNISGMLGSLRLAGQLEPFLPWLLAGQLTHVGKGTAYGMGRYRILQVTA